MDPQRAITAKVKDFCNTRPHQNNNQNVFNLHEILLVSKIVGTHLAWNRFFNLKERFLATPYHKGHVLLLSLVKWDTNVTIRRQISSSIFTINIFSELEDECNSMHKKADSLRHYSRGNDRGNEHQRAPI